ncbi:MAG: ABC transporter ATP-binding protein, partial [Bacteroidota bacterium]
MAENATPKKESRTSLKAVFRTYIWPRRKLLGLGLLLVFVSRIAGFVLPYSPKYLIDEVIANGQMDMLYPLLGLVVLAVGVQALTSFFLVKLLSVEAQYMIAELRSQVQQQILRLPIRFFDNTKSGSLVSRVMTDVEGVRNLVGTGFTQLIGGIITAIGALCFMIAFSWKLTAVS